VKSFDANTADKTALLLLLMLRYTLFLVVFVSRCCSDHAERNNRTKTLVVQNRRASFAAKPPCPDKSVSFSFSNCLVFLVESRDGGEFALARAGERTFERSLRNFDELRCRLPNVFSRRL